MERGGMVLKGLGIVAAATFGFSGVVGGAWAQSDPPSATPLSPLPVLRCLPSDLTLIYAPDRIERTGQVFALGASDINAQSANGRTGVGISREGTVTTLRWPSVLAQTQVEHYGPDPYAPRTNSPANNGVMLGLVVAGKTRWLRDFPQISQRYVYEDSDEIENTFVDSALGLRVTVRHVVGADVDALVQRVSVEHTGTGPRPTSVIAYENFSLSVGGVPNTAGFFNACVDRADRARFDGVRSIVHSKEGIDQTTGKFNAVAIAMGVSTRPDSWQVGADLRVSIPGRLLGVQDAYDDAADGTLSKNRRFSGYTNGALRAPLRFTGSSATLDVAIAGGRTEAAAQATVNTALDRGQPAVAAAKNASLAASVARAPMPNSPDPALTRLSKRTAVLIATTQSPSGGIPAAISPWTDYGFVWPREGLYFTEVLHLMGLHDRAEAYSRFLIRTQRRPGFKVRGDLGIPMGAWPAFMYDSGASAVPIPYEMDEVGFGAMTLWRQYVYTRDRAYLRDAWPAIERAADFLTTRCVDRTRKPGLPCISWIDDNPVPMQNVIGSVVAWQGLTAAIGAAREMGMESARIRYENRRTELRAAIERYYWRPKLGTYANNAEDDILWTSQAAFPEPFVAPNDPRALSMAEAAWKQIAPSFQAPAPGSRKSGLYEGQGLLAVADAWAGRPDKRPLLDQAAHWLASVNPTPDTGHLGESWVTRKGKVFPVTAVPQLWNHVLVYLGAIRAFGTAER